MGLLTDESDTRALMLLPRELVVIFVTKAGEAGSIGTLNVPPLMERALRRYPAYAQS